MSRVTSATVTPLKLVAGPLWPFAEMAIALTESSSSFRI